MDFDRDILVDVMVLTLFGFKVWHTNNANRIKQTKRHSRLPRIRGLDFTFQYTLPLTLILICTKATL